jgi:hypothetical protein
MLLLIEGQRAKSRDLPESNALSEIGEYCNLFLLFKEWICIYYVSPDKPRQWFETGRDSFPLTALHLGFNLTLTNWPLVTPSLNNWQINMINTWMWQVTAMFSRLKITFETRIRSLSWLDEPTRKDALHKLASLRGHFLTWPQLWNQTYVASLLQDVSCHATPSACGTTHVPPLFHTSATPC